MTIEKIKKQTKDLKDSPDTGGEPDEYPASGPDGEQDNPEPERDRGPSGCSGREDNVSFWTFRP